MIKKLLKFISEINIVYLITIAVSIGLILFSFVPYGWKVWESILVGIGCSGIAAALMAIFLDLHSDNKEKKRKEQLRQVFLSGLNTEFKHLFERLLWFDKHINQIDLSKDIDHYLSLDFIQETIFERPPRYTSLKECGDEIKQVSKKYELEELKTLDLETNKKIEKMFLIIGTASMSLLSELEIIRRNEMYLIANEIFTVEELNDIYVSINQHVDLLKTPETNYGTALSFLLYGYQKVYEWGHFDQDIMVISWQHSKNVVELLIEKRTKQSAHKVEESQVQKTKQDKKKKRKKR